MNKLFDEFNKVSPAAWKQKIQVDLKGADYNESLLWESEEGIVIKPFYTQEDRTHQKVNVSNKGFLVCQSIFVDKTNIASSLALDAIRRGATAIQFIAHKKFNIEKLLKDIDRSITLYFQFHFLDESFITSLAKDTNSFEVYFQLDIYGNLARSGNWFQNKAKDSEELKKIIQANENTVCIDGTLYQNAGANKTQQLAYILAQTNEYIEEFGTEVISKLHYQISVGSNYFFEISKLRALRILLNTLFEKHGVKNHSVHIFCQPSKRNKTLYDYNVNMLRTTSECMSGILGGANTISNLAYDAIYHKSNEFGERISRNQLLILQQESYLSDSQEYADGSYFIEQLTSQLAEKSLNLFKLIEKSGGFLSQLKKGSIQKKIKESADKEQEKFSKKELVLLGTNKLTNEKDRMKDSLELFPFVKSNRIKTLFPPILEKRISEQSEQERLTKE